MQSLEVPALIRLGATHQLDHAVQIRPQLAGIVRAESFVPFQLRQLLAGLVLDVGHRFDQIAVLLDQMAHPSAVDVILFLRQK